jgi:hypothetical protein
MALMIVWCRHLDQVADAVIEARVGTCLRHALIKLPKKLVAIASPVRKAVVSLDSVDERATR